MNVAMFLKAAAVSVLMLTSVGLNEAKPPDLIVLTPLESRDVVKDRRDERADYLSDLYFDVYDTLVLISEGGHDNYLIQHEIMLDEYVKAIKDYENGILNGSVTPVEGVSSRYDDMDYTIYQNEAEAILYILKANPNLDGDGLEDCRYHLLNLFDILEKYNL